MANTTDTIYSIWLQFAQWFHGSRFLRDVNDDNGFKAMIMARMNLTFGHNELKVCSIIIPGNIDKQNLHAFKHIQYECSVYN